MRHVKPELAHLVRTPVLVNAAEGLVEVGGERVGGGDDVVARHGLLPAEEQVRPEVES